MRKGFSHRTSGKITKSWGERTRERKTSSFSGPAHKINTSTNTNSQPVHDATPPSSPMAGQACFPSCSRSLHSYARGRQEFRSMKPETPHQSGDTTCRPVPGLHLQRRQDKPRSLSPNPTNHPRHQRQSTLDSWKQPAENKCHLLRVCNIKNRPPQGSGLESMVDCSWTDTSLFHSYLEGNAAWMLCHTINSNEWQTLPEKGRRGLCPSPEKGVHLQLLGLRKWWP